MSPTKLEILAYEDTPLGPICLRRRELLSEPGTLVTEVTLNHEFLMSSYNTDSERVIANRSVEMHSGERLRALVGGLGLGYTARELLQSQRITSVDVVEFLPNVIDWLKEGMIPLADELNADDRLTTIHGDVYQWLGDPPKQTFDLIVIDVDHSPDDQLAEGDHPFYTIAGLQRAKQHLRKNGILAVWSYAESSDFAEALRATFDRVEVKPVTTENTLVGHEQTDWLFFAVNDSD